MTIGTVSVSFRAQVQQWFQNPQVTLTKKVAAAVAAIFAPSAAMSITGSLLGFNVPIIFNLTCSSLGFYLFTAPEPSNPAPVLANPALIGFGYGQGLMRMSDQLRSLEGEALRALQSLQNEQNDMPFYKIKKALGVEQTFHNLPILHLRTDLRNGDSIDFLTPQDLSHSVMRGVDIQDRTFIALKVKQKVIPALDPFVITFFQKYANCKQWTWGSQNFPEEAAVAFYEQLRDTDFTQIEQIVRTKDHPILELVEP